MNCRRPSSVCYCAHLLPLQTRLRVVFLQHPREARVPISTARMAHLMLLNSELHKGVSFESHPRVQELVDDPGAALLFPGEGAQDPRDIDAGSVRTLVVLDGTWPQARKVLKQNPILDRLRRIGLVPAQPGNYRIRRPPAPDCLATIEAVSSALGALERAPERFGEMLAAFTFMVDRQIALAAARTGPPRHKTRTARQVRAYEELRDQLSRAVAIHVEVNGYPRADHVPDAPELVHLVAQRLATGETFQAVVAPRRTLAPNVPHHIGLEATRVLAGETLARALERWDMFARTGDVLCGWGSFARTVLEAAESAKRTWLDLRLLVARRQQKSPGDPSSAAQMLGAGPVGCAAPGRAGRTVTELAQIVTGLRAAQAQQS
jgi:DTW domain-containing protein YfiP